MPSLDAQYNTHQKDEGIRKLKTIWVDPDVNPDLYEEVQKVLKEKPLRPSGFGLKK